MFGSNCDAPRDRSAATPAIRRPARVVARATIPLLVAVALLGAACSSAPRKAYTITAVDSVVNEGDGVSVDVVVRRTNRRPFSETEWWRGNKRLTTDWREDTDRIESHEIPTVTRPTRRDSKIDVKVLKGRLADNGAVFVYWCYPSNRPDSPPRRMGVVTVPTSELGEEGWIEILLGRDAVEVKPHLKSASKGWF